MDGSARPVISVIVPVYHVEAYLRRCLDSILAQTFTDFELIVVNDGGTPAETAMCEEYAARDGRIVYVSQPNAGLSAARNTGLEHARGEWIMFVDSDDWVDEHFCEKALAGVTGTGARMCVFDLVYTQGDSREGSVFASRIAEGVYDARTIISARINGDIVCYAWNKIYHADIWESGIRFPVGEKWEDDAIMEPLFDAAGSIAVIHDALYFKSWRADSISVEAWRTGENAKWIYVQRRKRYDFLLEKYPDLIEEAESNLAATAMIYGIYCIRGLHSDAEFREARRWARDAGLRLKSRNPRDAAAYWMFLHCKPLFRIVALVYSKLNPPA